MNELTTLRNDIAALIYAKPCDFDDLCAREMLANKSQYGIQLLVRRLYNLDALYYKGEKMYIKKKWAKENLKDYDLDFRSEREKYIDGLSDFEKYVLGIKN
ncbi:hypothetical protein HN014_08050 [Aquimarina sp. TRL1]|uniref:hypothetical protein n=1 Tax=Aquimarina sp. (strain TRL1) TaxID=2736252 RepID=UPI0015889D81|nr:hypothetical protein [Aquimarina sp. TRL1]QKX04870.1 hypothetical protein HN014_08050 [Aquimarina sp. TRL1]